MAAGLGGPFGAPLSSASQSLHEKTNTEGQAASQKPMQEHRPQLWPLGSGALTAAAGLQATGQIFSTLEH